MPRKKSTSTDVSPVRVSRRSSRRSRKSPSLSETEKNAEPVAEEQAERDADGVVRASSEEREPPRKNRSTRTRTQASPAKRRKQRGAISPEPEPMSPIDEEENGCSISITNANVANVDADGGEQIETETEIETIATSADVEPVEELTTNEKSNEEQVEESVTVVVEECSKCEEPTETLQNEAEAVENVDILNASPLAPSSKDSGDDEAKAIQSDAEDVQADSDVEREDQPQPAPDKEEESMDSTIPENIQQLQLVDSNEPERNDCTLIEHEIVETAASENVQEQLKNTEDSSASQTLNVDAHVEIAAVHEEEHELEVTAAENGKPSLNDSVAITVATAENTRTRKRKWITKKAGESKAPVLSISTDSLRNIIADVRPVPLSDIQLDSSSEVEEIVSEREEGEETPPPLATTGVGGERQKSQDKIEKTSVKRTQNETEAGAAPTGHDSATLAPSTQRSPSPARNQASSVLYITNLVRPFTVLQLKGLLARTGKIVENGFWIDRIKSKCYVEYENDDEAVETRHALHGVRWPVSNPKCLNVDFGKKADMERVIQSTKDDAPKLGQDNKDNLIVGTGWNRDRSDAEDKKGARPVREWDVGKKENLDRDKSRDLESRRSRERDVSGNRENERHEKDGKSRSKYKDQRSSSLSPARKLKKKENEPPLRLLDDLFRKTKATPSIYWLPLTPEQITEKEVVRQKRIEEHKQRIKQRELERGKEREVERGRGNDRDRDRDREHKRNRSSDHRRSRSRERRRY